MDELAKRFADLAEKYGPTVVEAAKQAATVEGYSTVVAGVLTLVVGSIFVYIDIVLIRKILRDSWDEITWFPVGLIGLVATVCLLLGIWNLIDPWTWTAIHHPELWLAKKALHI